MNLLLNTSPSRLRKTLVMLSVLLLAAVAGLLAAWWYWTHRYDGLIAAAAQQHSLDPALVKAIVYEESFFSPGAHSSQNAVGLMQVTPVVAQHWIEATHARSLADAIAAIPNQPAPRADPTFDETFTNPVINLYVGCWYLQSLLNRYKDQPDPLALALAAYNAGPTNVDRWAPSSERNKISRQEFIARIDYPATRSYVQKIIQRYDDYH